MRIGCVVLAAGSARRFGSNKLLARVEGKPLIRRCLEAVPPDLETVVVSSCPEAAALSAEFGFALAENAAPEAGISRSVRLGLARLTHCAGVLFLAADQPWLRRQSLEKLTALWEKEPQKIAALSHRRVRGSPCLFPQRLFPALMALSGDEGGRQIIRRNREALLLLEVEAAELMDVDTPAALCLARRRGPARDGPQTTVSCHSALHPQRRSKEAGSE